ncbi:MAG: M48 family metalloprotease [Sandaracinaceae bacterium]|nr:M48 family metalloprotease [Sandaracinaceae bacterium]
MGGLQDEAATLAPPKPDGVPPDLTVPTGAYRLHAWLAFGGLLLFLGLYLGLTGYLGWIVYRVVSDSVASGNLLRALLAIPPAFFCLFLVRGLFVVKHLDDPTRIEVTEAEQPALFAFVRRVAEEAGAPCPRRIFLTARVNAAVFYDLSFRNLLLPSRKHLEIGLGLVEALTLDELKAVIAHELGHFAQKTMAVGRWVYVAHQIAGGVVAHRGWVDRMLHGLSYTDLRIAWIGWLGRLLVWSIRAVLDTAYRLIVLAHRALGREMELQADLVAVSVSGSDSLIHALHRLGPADSAWEQAARFANGEIDKKRPPADLFALQAGVLEHLRRVLDDPALGAVPERPRAAREMHRVFEAELAQPPRMWSTHPPNREREDNAKRRYVPSALDARPAWTLFRDADALRRAVSRKFFDAGGPTPIEEPAVPIEETLARLDEDYRRPSLERRFRGVYLNRTVVGHVAKVADLYERVDATDPAAILAAIDRLYPESLKAELERYVEVRDEKGLLTALQDGVLDAPGGVIRHRGREIPRKELGEVLKRVGGELEAAEARLLAHDRKVRSLHRAAARALSPAWAGYLEGLLRFVHYTDHVSANLRDAHGYLLHAVNIVLADGHVSGSERRWLLSAAGDLYGVLESFHRDREWLQAPERVEEEAGELWGEVLEREFTLPPPMEHDLGDWLDVIDGWVFLTCVPLEKASRAALDRLLEAEDHVARCLREGADPGSPPSGASTPDRYTPFVEGAHRERQKRLGWWDRFVTADGFVPGLLRLIVASVVLVPALALGGLAVGDATVHVHNGLGVPVVVTVGDARAQVPARGTGTLDVGSTGEVRVVARTLDGREIEDFVADVAHARVDYVYNVASAAVLFRWTAHYDSRGGRDSPARSIGAPRWLEAHADVVLREPPASVTVSSRSSSASREVLSAMSTLPAVVAASEVADAAERRAMIHAHLRFDASDDPELGGWVAAAADDPELPRFVAERAAAEPQSAFWLRMEQQSVPAGDARRAVCDRQRAALAAAPTSTALLYATARCIEDPEERGARMLSLHERHPDDAWLTVVAGYEHARHARFEQAQGMLGRARAIPAIWPGVAVDVARLRRVLAADPDAEPLDELAAESPPLAGLRAYELPADDPALAPMVRPWHLLAARRLAEAVEAAAAGPQAAVILRLAAASEGASAGVVADAWALDDAAGLDGTTVWPTLALAARHGRDVAPFVAYARTLEEPATADALARLATEALAARDLGAVERAVTGLEPRLRGHALVMGIVLFGEQAPEAWRREARALLFARERPYFR